MSAGASRPANTQAHVVTRYDAVAVEYQLPVSGRVRASLLDVLGRQVSKLDAGEQNAGTHRLIWDRDQEGRNLSAGAYFVLLDTGAEKARLKAVIR
jgi:flagellar hook assembly protein FlgD